MALLFNCRIRIIVNKSIALQCYQFALLQTGMVLYCPEKRTEIFIMRIGIEVQHMLRPKKHGTDIIILELLKQLQNIPSKHEFFLYTQANKQQPVFITKENMHVDISRPASAYVWEQQVLPAAIERHDINLLHCTSNTAPVGLKLPLILTIHDVGYLEKWMLRYGSWYQRFEIMYTQWNMPRIAKMADLIITVSDYEREKIIERLQIPAHKVKTIYHACAPHFTPATDTTDLETYRKKWKLPERYVLLFGNISPGKNVPNVLRALNILHRQNKLDFKLVMPDITEEKLQRLLTFHELQHLRQHIFLTGYIPNIELPNLYRLAELFLYPSINESFGMPILEAMACGTPVLTSKRGAIPEIAGNAALFTDPKNPEEISEKLYSVLNDRSLRTAAKSRGIKRAANFSWHKTTSEIIRHYESFLS